MSECLWLRLFRETDRVASALTRTKINPPVKSLVVAAADDPAETDDAAQNG